MTKLRSLQAGRGLAAVLVVLFHATILSDRRFGWTFAAGVLNFGFAGVDFFFVLSGFIIYYVHCSDLGRREKLRAYFLKRATRVVPTYWFWTFVFLPFFFAFSFIGEGFERTLQGILGSLFFIHQNHSPIIRAGWSLNFEVFFYLIFAVGIFVSRRWSKMSLVLWASIIVASNIFWCEPYTDFFLSPYHLEFILGIVTGYAVIHGFERFSLALFVAGLILFGFGAYFTPQLVKGLGQFQLPLTIGVPSAFIIYGACVLEQGGRLKIPDFLVALGDASYSIYLTHGNFLSGWARLVPMKTGVLMSANVLITVLLGYLAFKYIEKPLIGFARGFAEHV